MLCRNLVEKDINGELDGFWNKIYNIGGGENCRNTGFETIDEGFKLMGRGTKSFFKPNWNIARNFHGGWFYDSGELDDILQFRTESNADFWKRMSKKYAYYKAGKIVPKSVISKCVIQRLFKNTNAPKYWIKHDKTGRIKAFFGGREQYDAIPDKWEDYPLLCEGKLQNGSKIDYAAYKEDRKSVV